MKRQSVALQTTRRRASLRPLPTRVLGIAQAAPLHTQCDIRGRSCAIAPATFSALRAPYCKTSLRAALLPPRSPGALLPRGGPAVIPAIPRESKVQSGRHANGGFAMHTPVQSGLGVGCWRCVRQDPVAHRGANLLLLWAHYHAMVATCTEARRNRLLPRQYMSL